MAEEVGAMIASTVGKQIINKLGEVVKDEITLLWGFRNDVKAMEEKMKDLEAVMNDADDRLRRGERDGEAVGRWLTKFKSVAYDVEDVLDDLDANELIKKTQSKLKLFFSRNNQLLQRIHMAHNMKSVKEKIGKIENEGLLTLNLQRRGSQAEWRRNEETFAAIGDQGMKTGMVGRDAEKEKIINLLLRSEASEHISIIPIIGLAGLGKSTLAESISADERVNNFSFQAWVHVSKPFDLRKIGSSIMKSINSSINLDNCTLQFLRDNLKTELASARYLIILDDLWEEDGNKLEELKQMLQYGCKGSRIIVTTRNQGVVAKMGTGVLANQKIIRPVPESDQIKLGILSTDDCWEVMKQRVFGPDDDQSGLEEIGREIAAKCGGVPLIANSLGSVLSELRTVKAWEDIRDTKIDLGSRDQKDTLERLMLSYHYMKLEFKMCFTYLAAFPKGFVMDGDRLIQQWIALGYIQAKDDGERCIKYLLGMSFLQISWSSSVSPSPVHAKAPQKLTMHDLVHDLASTITASEFVVLDANASEPSTLSKSHYFRHAQVINYRNQSKVFRNLPAKVRSLHFRNSGKQQLPRTAFFRSKRIRVLDLNGHSVRGQSIPSNLDHGGCSVEDQYTPSNIVLPSSIHSSKLLRYLDATALPITSLPKSFHTLQYMQTLILSNCSLETLPGNICSLHKLCYLDLSGNSRLDKLPVSLGKLSKLSFLNLLGCYKLQELPKSICELTNLRHLDMSDCSAIQKLPDEFGSLPKLIFLSLFGCSKLTKLPGIIRLDSLEHLNLSNCHELENLPKDFGNLQKLGFLNLSDCYKVTELPESFCHLTHLKDLNLSDCHEFSELPDCFGNLSELESLNLTSCCKLQLLPKSLCNLFKLKHLNLSYCMRLRNLPSSLGDLKLQSLDISSALSIADLPDSISSMTSLTQLKVTSAEPEVFDKALAIRSHLNLPESTFHSVHEIEHKGCSSIVELAQLNCRELYVEELQNVRYAEDAERAKLRDKSDLRMLSLQWGFQGEEDRSVLERLVPPRSTEQFVLAGYMSKDFPDWMSQISSYLPALTFLHLSDLGTCNTLPPFGRLPNLRSLSMTNIPNIRKIGKEIYGESGTCRKLRSIVLDSMENFEEWWTTQSGEENEDFLIPNLHEVKVIDCPKLKFLPYPPRCMLWFLKNSDEVLPQGGFGKLLSSTHPFKMVIVNCNFSPDKWDRLQHLPTLEILQVESCGGLGVLPEAIRCFSSLTSLKLVSLKDLELLPEWLGHLTSLEGIWIQDCPIVTFFPESMKNLAALRVLWLEKCNALEVLPEWIGELTSLQEFTIIDCPNLTSFSESMRNLTALRELQLNECKGLDVLPEGLGQLTSLQELSIVLCSNLISFPQSMKNLTALRVLWLEECNDLDILPEWLGQLNFLQQFNISRCPNLTSLPESMKNLTALRKLQLNECNDLDVLPEGLGQLTSLQEFYIIRCPNLTSLPESMKNLTALRELQLKECKGLDVLPAGLGQLTSLEEFRIICCPNLTSLPESMKNLTALRLLWLEECNVRETLPEWIGQLTSIEEFYMTDCPILTSLPESMKNLTSLRKLLLKKCNVQEILPEWIGQLTSIQEFIIDCSNLTSLPEHMKNLTGLRVLWLKECKGLEILPEWIGQFIALQEFNIIDCPNLTSLPESIRNLTTLQEFNIIDCPNLTSLPESIRNLTTLKELCIWGCPTLVDRCQGEDANMVSHIPKVKLCRGVEKEMVSTSQDGGEEGQMYNTFLVIGCSLAVCFHFLFCVRLSVVFLA